MPSGRKGVTKDFVKQAYQRARRLMKGPIRGAEKGAFQNPALNQFYSTMQAISRNGKKMSAGDRTKLREAAARKFLESGMSTKTEIMIKYEKEKKYMSQKARDALQNDPNLIARYLEGNKNQKQAIISEYYLDSSQFRAAHMRIYESGLNKRNFYEWISDATDAKRRKPDISNAELNDRIQNYKINW